MGKRIKGKNKKMVGPTFGGGNGRPQEWRVRVGIWRSMENRGAYRGPAGVDFLSKTFKFWSRGPYRGPHWKCSDQYIFTRGTGFVILVPQLAFTDSWAYSVDLETMEDGGEASGT
jgi:hypothetical protein